MQDKITADAKKILTDVKNYVNCKTFRDLAEYLGVDEALIYSWRNRNSIGDPAVILDKCKNIRLAYLLTGEGPMLEAETQEETPTSMGWMPSPTRGIHKIPIISWVKAGTWATVEDPFQPNYSEEFVYISETCGPNTFALRVVGDSMEPEFVDGDIILVDPSCAWSNRDYIIAKNGEEATFKQIVVDGPNTYLKPLNKGYKPIDMTGKDFRIVGVVIQKVKKYKG